jgi:YjjI family glycine radical enzyme
MNPILKIIKDTGLSYEQMVTSLAKEAENSIMPLNLDEDTKKWIEDGIICDLFEGNAPYRPRYIVVDFEKFMEQGSNFLELKKPEDIWEATHNLLILYKHIPSITTMPVYIGNLDYLLDPYVKDEEESYKAIKLFLNHIDKTITDSFCHGNIGPKETKAGYLILRAINELNNPTPNISIKYDEDITSHDFAMTAAESSLYKSKPSFANHKQFTKDLKGEYAIVSCYNGLKIGGGAYTLVRTRLGRLAKEANTKEEFLNLTLKKLVDKMTSFMDERIRFLVEESAFFKSNFLVNEGLISKENFTGMFGVVGLAECVNTLMEKEGKTKRFGQDEEANSLGEDIIAKLEEYLNSHTNEHCIFSEGKFLLHSQVGLDTDSGESPGCRIPVGEEPELVEHLIQSAPFHKYFPSGIGDIFVFEETAKTNLDYVLDIVKGSFNSGMRYLSFYCGDCDVVRVTGYLVKKSEIEKLEKGKAVLRDTTVLGMGARNNMKAFDRKKRDIE